MQADIIKKLIQEKLNDANILIETDDDYHFTAMVVSEFFVNQKSLARQRMVYEALTPYLVDGSLHALSLKTYTPLEWQKKLKKG
ncbi:MAG: putative transcriptional regulator, BolA superfamily [Francisellaceae bacterium]|nr:putative transcriptional regulator, BolA superfamily [Francisellaceae bacterium]